MPTSSPKLHIIVDSREPSVTFAKDIFEEKTTFQLGKVEHIRNITFTERFKALSAVCKKNDMLLVSLHWLAEAQLQEMEHILIKSKLTPKQLILASYECFSHIHSWCQRTGCTFRANPYKRRVWSGKNDEKVRIWIQYRLMIAIISHTESLGVVSQQVILGTACKGTTTNAEYDRAIRYFERGEPDMAGGTYSCENPTQANPIDLLRERLNKIAATDFNVLVKGDSGTGKEAAAWAIHEFSSRRDKPFLTINCAGLPDELLESEMFGYMKGSHNQATKDTPGLLEAANGGTLFLDELPDMSPRTQAKLLRFTENGEYRPLGANDNRYSDVRIISAAQPERLDSTSGVRPDLKSRLSQLDIQIMPLRQAEKQSPGVIFKLAFILLERYTWTRIFHNGQVRELAPFDIKEFQSKLALKENMSRVSSQDWKDSNIRELDNFLRQWVVFGDNELQSLNGCSVVNHTQSSTPEHNIYDDSFRGYLQEPKNRTELKRLSASKPIINLKKAYTRHLFAIYSQIIQNENVTQDLPRKPTQKEFATLMNITENTLSRLLN